MPLAPLSASTVTLTRLCSQTRTFVILFFGFVFYRLLIKVNVIQIIPLQQPQYHIYFFVVRIYIFDVTIKLNYLVCKQLCRVHLHLSYYNYNIRITYNINISQSRKFNLMSLYENMYYYVYYSYTQPLFLCVLVIVLVLFNCCNGRIISHFVLFYCVSFAQLVNCVRVAATTNLIGILYSRTYSLPLLYLHHTFTSLITIAHNSPLAYRFFDYFLSLGKIPRYHGF